MRRRFFRAALISILAGLIIAFLFAVPLMEQLYADDAEQRLSTALVMAEGYEAADGEYAAIAQKIGKLLAENGEEMRLTIIAEDGLVLGDSQSAVGEMENHRERPEVKTALRTGRGRDIRHSETQGIRMMYLADRLDTPEGEAPQGLRSGAAHAVVLCGHRHFSRADCRAFLRPLRRRPPDGAAARPD